MIHSNVIIDGVDVTETYGLYLVERHLTNPETKVDYIEIPDMNGSLDATEAMGLRYNDRIISLQFIYPVLGPWDDVFSRFSNFLHGKKHRIIFGEDPNWYYTGRITLEEFNGPERTITGTARVYPYKFATELTTVSQAVSGTAEILLENDYMTVVPEVTVTSEMTLAWGSNSATVEEGTYRIAGLELDEGTTRVTVTGTGTITFTYRKGRL